MPFPNHLKNKTRPTFTGIPDKLWDRISIMLPTEKSDKTVGRPAVPFRKVMDGIVYVKNRMPVEDAA